MCTMAGTTFRTSSSDPQIIAGCKSAQWTTAPLKNNVKLCLPQKYNCQSRWGQVRTVKTSESGYQAIWTNPIPKMKDSCLFSSSCHCPCLQGSRTRWPLIVPSYSNNLYDLFGQHARTSYEKAQYPTALLENLSLACMEVAWPFLLSCKAILLAREVKPHHGQFFPPYHIPYPNVRDALYTYLFWGHTARIKTEK